MLKTPDACPARYDGELGPLELSQVFGHDEVAARKCGYLSP
jgi:hypothetical protein